ncbi:MAG: sugar transferase [Candidatus Saccharibacteria bacterium]|nr:sugar transferase [Candidatus Saccharibacteria bacterium]
MPEKTQTKSLKQESLQVETRVSFLSPKVYARMRSVHFFAYGVLKRILDLGLASMMIVALSPVFLVVAILIKLDSPGPILFRQERVGKGGKIFKILKFRSMVAENDLRDYSRKDEYTKVGKAIRRFSLDELPQLFNVVAGQMSFVGPRPWVVEYWTNMNYEERERARVLPGITGLAQVKGRNAISIFQKIQYDLIYVNNFSLKQDIKVILLTIKTVVSGSAVDAGKEGVRDDIRDLKARR